MGELPPGHFLLQLQRHEARVTCCCGVALQRSKGWLGHAPRWATSTPAKREAEPNFDPELIRAWLGVESPAPTDGKTSCSSLVQTEVSHTQEVPAEPAEKNVHPEEDSGREEEQRIRSQLGSEAELRSLC